MKDPGLQVKLKFLVLAAVLAVLWLLAAPTLPSSGERALWEQLRAAQTYIAEWREQNGIATPRELDPHACGLIGVEWSAITTTLGDLEAKRTACDPAWAVQFSRWYAELGLAPGDRVAIYSSASFPGFLLSALAAAEARGLEPFLVVSLGASTWGANHPDVPWPVLAAVLRRGGFLQTKADFYTPGGGGESGGGMPPEGLELLRRAARDAGVDWLQTTSLEETIALKHRLLERHGVRLLVSIGGPHANMGDDPGVLRLEPGLLLPGEAGPAGNGVIGRALDSGLPVIHMLNTRELSGRSGIPFDAAPGRKAPLRLNAWWSLAALALFFGVLLAHRRWRLV